MVGVAIERDEARRSLVLESGVAAASQADLKVSMERSGKKWRRPCVGRLSMERSPRKLMSWRPTIGEVPVVRRRPASGGELRSCGGVLGVVLPEVFLGPGPAGE